MRSIIFSFALLATCATVNCSKPSCIYKPDAQDKKNTTQLTEYQIFAQRYEAAFGEKPSTQVWSLGKDTCNTSNCVSSCTGE
jgi:hypothetical protein